MKISYVCDAETTGLPLSSTADLEKQPHIIEWAYAKYEDGKFIDKFSWLIHPGIEITAEITKITGITNEDLKDAKPFAEVLPWIEESLQGVDVMWAHNMPFDRGMLQFELKRLGKLEEFKWPAEQICSVQEFRHLFGKRPKLTELYKHVIGIDLAQKHRAMADVEALCEILVKENML